jgi:hypothetical protein
MSNPNVTARIEIPRAPFVFHELLEPHERASNTPGRKKRSRASAVLISEGSWPREDLRNHSQKKWK